MFHPQGPTLFELARQALSSTDRGYDLLAPKFDYTPFRTPDGLLDVVAPFVGEVDRAVDLCCGTGAVMRMLRPHCRTEVVGIDRSQGMLDEAERRLGPEGTKVRLVLGDVLNPPFEAEFDLATCFGAFGHILEADEPRFVQQVHRVLRPGGRFVFVTAESAPLTSPTTWVARGFNAVMHLRNAVWKPEFIMFYLTFLLPRARELLAGEGFDVRVHRQLFPAPFGRLVLVEAMRR